MKNTFFKQEHISRAENFSELHLARKYYHSIINGCSDADDKSISEARIVINKASSVKELKERLEDFHNTYEPISEPDPVIDEDIRKVLDSDFKNYEAMIEMYVKKYVQKNWNEATMSKHQQDVSLGNSGYSMRDMRQQLAAELVVALQKYNPDYRTKDGRSVKESTFVYQHLFNRVGQLMKKLTKKRYGYGVWSSNIEEVLWETDRE